MNSDTILPEDAASLSGRSVVPPTRPTKRRIVVVFVTDNMRLGGTELNAVRTAELLDRERFELRVVCLGEDGPLTERYRAIGISVVNMPISSFYGASMLRSGFRFVRYARRVRADIVHAHDVYSNIFAGVWAPVARVPVLITSRRWWHSLPSRKLQIANRIAFRRATAVLANSPQVAGSVRAESKIPSERVWAITNFADDSAFDSLSAEARRNRRAEWGAQDDAVVIGCVARFDPVKDHLGLVRAFAQVHLRHPETRLVLIGDGEMRSGIEALVSELGMQHAVHLAGEIRDRGNLHYGFDISVLASRSEGFPNTLVEAMAAANPVVATAVGGCVDAVEDEATGLLVPAARPDELAASIERLVDDPALRQRFGAEGRRRAVARYRAAHVLGALERMYDQLLANRVK